MLISCNIKNDSFQKNKISSVENFEKRDSVILKVNGSYETKNFESFSLETSDINIVYSVLLDTIKKHNSRSQLDIIPLVNLKKQILPYISDNKKYIIIQTFCGEFSKSSLKNLIEIKDGGSCFVRMLYDWDNRKILYFSVNSTC